MLICGGWRLTPSDSPATAASITVAETLELFEGRFEALAQGVADGAYALWLGSGVSRDRLPGLDRLVVKVLVFLHDHSDAENPECPYRKALEEAVGLARLRSHERDELDLDQTPTEWAHLNLIVDGLTDQYHELLAIEITGKAADYLVWEAVEVRETYGAGLEPDCEHLCLAILVLEGAVSEMVSANWDGLIEAALTELTGDSDDVLRVVVLPDDLRGSDRDAMLLKVHGCAVLAKREPEKYRAAIIASRPQITIWLDRSDLGAIHTKMRLLASTIPTLVIGLSIQDENLQQLFSGATADLRWPWPADPPAHVFGDEALGPDQINVLRVVYGEDYTANAGEIKAQSLIRAFGKPLLTALVLFVLGAKLRVYLRKAGMPHLGSGEREEMELGLRRVEHRLASGVGSDHLGFIRGLVSGQRRAISLFREGAEPTPGSARYARISRMPAAQAGSDPDIATNGLRELAAGIALLGRGEAAGSWSLASGPLSSGTAGALKVTKGDEETAVFFAANGAAALRLHRDGIADASDSDTLIIHSTEPAHQVVRSPRPSYGRDGRSSRREVHLRELLATAPGLAALEESFRQEAAL